MALQQFKSHTLSAQLRLQGWILTLAIGCVAAIVRFARLDYPKAIMFDETYYVKGAWSMLTYGWERSWAEGSDEGFSVGDYSGLLDEPDRWVHPPFGRWIMAQGMRIDPDSGWGWRFATALLGVLLAMLTVRIALRMFTSLAIALLVGLAVALDGMGITMSRTGLLDGILAFFILLGFWAVLRDREWLARNLIHNEKPTSARLRPWAIVAGVAIGLACGVKWSGAFAGAAFGILIWVWGTLLHVEAHTSKPLLRGLRDGFRAFYNYVPAMALSYVLSWFPWFFNSNGWDRQWAAQHPNDVPFAFLPDALNSFLHWHTESASFHTGLNSPHTYQSQAWVWILQLRPVSFYWADNKSLPANACSSDTCVGAITSIGNPVVWWAGFAALIVVLYLVSKCDWRAIGITAGYLGTWVVWFFFPNRTTFQFYAIALLPFVALALGLAVTAISERRKQAYTFDGAVYPALSSRVLRRETSLADFDAGPRLPVGGIVEIPPVGKGRTILTVLIILITLAALFWLPIWMGTPVPYWFWHAHMWFPSWI